MLHHQHAVPMPPNQIRDPNRMAAQLPLRMGQPGNLGGPHRSRPPPPILMGMHHSPQPPQPNGVVPGVVVSMPTPVMTSGPGSVVPPSHAAGPSDVRHSVDTVVQQHRRHPRQRQFLPHLHHHPLPPSQPPVSIQQRPPIPPLNSTNHQVLLGHMSRQKRDGCAGRGGGRMVRSAIESVSESGVAERRVGDVVSSTPAPPVESRGVMVNPSANSSSKAPNGVALSEKPGTGTPPMTPPTKGAVEAGSGDSTAVQMNQQQRGNVANTKEKTPMCLINELARLNKIQHQYRLTNETGPAHKKKFTVMLQLGGEEYEAEGHSIKKAQHAAAALALNSTTHRHPPLRLNPAQRSGAPRLGKSNITPTVELNALAMKRGEPAVYTFMEPPHLPPHYPMHHHHPPVHHPPIHHPPSIPPPHVSQYMPPQGLNYRGIYNQVNSRGGQEDGLFPFGCPQHPFSCRGDKLRQVNGACLEDGHLTSSSLPYSSSAVPSHPHHMEAFHQRHVGGGSFHQGPMGSAQIPRRYHYGGGGLGGKAGVMSAPMYSPMYVVSLRVGDREFFGEGHNAQLARHDAASKALELLKNLPQQKMIESNGMVSDDGLTPVVETNGTHEEVTHAGSKDGAGLNADLKSPISLVHELALKQGLEVTFEVTGERGPPHMRTFTTQCIVGDLVTEGEGNGKKVSKKHAAEKMLAELRKLPTLSPPPLMANNRQRRKPTAKKKTRNLIKVQQEQKAKVDYGEDINPISRLIQIQQAKKEHEPVYTLIEERGIPRHRREFVMEVSVENMSCTGTGPNKKLAKRAAAEGLLRMLGYVRPGLQNMAASMNSPSKPTTSSSSGTSNSLTIRNSSSSNATSSTAHHAASSMLHGEVKTKDELGDRKVTFLEDGVEEDGSGIGGSGSSVLNLGGSGGRQLVPGLLLIGDSKVKQNFNQTSAKIGQGHVGVRSVQSSSGGRVANLQTTAAIAKELLRGGTSATAEALLKSGAYHHCPSQSPPVHSDSKNSLDHRSKSRQQENNSSPVVRPKDQLMYLAQLLNFQVQFSDFPKGNHSEFLSLVSLSTEPPQVCHGAGKTTDASHDQAALTALRALSELGLDSVTSSGNSLKKEVSVSSKTSMNNPIVNAADSVHMPAQSTGRQSQAAVIVASDGVSMGK